MMMKILAEPIDVISKTLRNGTVVPVKFRAYQDEVAHDIKVDHIISSEESKYAGTKAIIFSCQSEINGTLKRYELKLILDKHKWELFKM